MRFKTLLMDEMALNRAIKRISHEILEKNNGCENIVLVGIKTRGIPFAEKIRDNLKELENVDVPVEKLDITLYRDDLSELNDYAKLNSDEIQGDMRGKKVILCDDVLYTGRTVRAAIDATMKHGRPKVIQLAVLVDRGHREIPIRADYVGKNVPTSHEEVVAVKFLSTDSVEKVELYQKD